MSEVVQTRELPVEGAQRLTLDECIADTGIENTVVKGYWKPAWERNFLGMWQHIRPDTRNLREVLFKSDGETAVIVGTGPSLDRNIDEMLAADRSRFKLIACTSALNPLLVRGLEPDLAVINDGQPWITDWHVKGLEQMICAAHDGRGFPLALQTTAHPSTASGWPSRLLFYHDSDPGDSLIGGPGSRALNGTSEAGENGGLVYRHLKDIVGIPVSGCTTNCAARIAVLMGCHRVILLGTDFAFPVIDGIPRSHCTKYSYQHGEWRPREVDPEFYIKKARYLLHICKGGCWYTITRWSPTDPLVWDSDLAKCPECHEETDHVPVSGEYMFYMNQAMLIATTRPKVELDDRIVDRPFILINATGAGSLRGCKQATFAEALDLVLVEVPAVPGATAETVALVEPVEVPEAEPTPEAKPPVESVSAIEAPNEG